MISSLAGLFFATTLAAQTATSYIAGQVTDAAGKPAPNVTVTVENVTTGQINNFDVFATKRFSYRDAFSIELRGDAYNVFNHAQYTADPTTALFPSNFGNTSPLFIPGSTGFGDVSIFYGSNPRLLQVALRLVW